MNSVPRLSIGLPVYNGENYLAESLEALLGQTYEDFELIISDNASVDGTEEVCRQYAKQDSRIRYIRQPRNIGLAPNHNVLLNRAQGEFFKWASHDDLYARDLIRLCVRALDKHPHVVLAHSWTALIDGSGTVTKAIEYPCDTDSLHAPRRFRSMLFDDGGDEDGGVIRTRALRSISPLGSYYHSDRTIIAELALYGPFYHVPDWLYFRRDHPGRATRAFTGARNWCAHQDPRRGDRLRHPLARLYGEYVWGFVTAVRRSPISPAERRECYFDIVRWAASRALARHSVSTQIEPVASSSGISIDTVVPGREKRSE